MVSVQFTWRETPGDVDRRHVDRGWGLQGVYNIRLPTPLAIAYSELQVVPLVQGRVTTTTQQKTEFTGQRCQNDNINHDKNKIFVYLQKIKPTYM